VIPAAEQDVRAAISDRVAAKTLRRPTMRPGCLVCPRLVIVPPAPDWRPAVIITGSEPLIAWNYRPTVEPGATLVNDDPARPRSQTRSRDSLLGGCLQSPRGDIWSRNSRTAQPRFPAVRGIVIGQGRALTRPASIHVPARIAKGDRIRGAARTTDVPYGSEAPICVVQRRRGSSVITQRVQGSAPTPCKDVLRRSLE